MAAREAPGQLSCRGLTISQKQSLPYFNDFFTGLQDVWSPTNSNGYILMAVAENHQNYAPLQQKVNATHDKRPETSGYCSMRGSDRFVKAFAGFVETVLAPTAIVDPTLLTVGTGCGSLFDHITHCICEAGDAVLVPSPMYAAFLNDCGVKAGAHVVPCPMDTPQWTAAAAAQQAQHPTSLPRHKLSVECLQAGYDAAVACGSRPRMLILVNPGNPTGGCFTPLELKGAVNWARERSLHVVVDEVYAAGVHYSGTHDPESAGAVPFRSALELFRPPGSARGAPVLGDDVHVMWGFSKDWGVSGYRIGVLYSQNASLNSALDNIGYFSAVSNHTQEAMAEVLEDKQWCAQYMRSNAQLVGRTYRAVVAALGAAGVPCMPADGGMYVWIDLRAALPKLPPSAHEAGEPQVQQGGQPATAATEVYKQHLDAAGVPWAAETALSEHLFKEHRVLLTPGRACCSSLAGFFRICITWMDEAGTLEGVRRIAQVYNQSAGTSRQAHAAQGRLPGSGTAFNSEAKL